MKPLCAIVLAPALTACSFVLTDKLPRTYFEAHPPQCTRTRLIALSDAVVAVTFVSVGVNNLDPSDGGYTSMGDLQYALLAAAGGFVAVSAIAGWRWTSRCRDARDDHEAWLAQHPEPAPVGGAPLEVDQSAAPGAVGGCRRRRSTSSRVNSLHGRARAAAHQGDCDEVLAHADAIRTLDPDYYLHSFRCDGVIAGTCDLPDSLVPHR